MIQCAHCGNQEYFGALFCGECGAQIISSVEASTQTLGGTREMDVGNASELFQGRVPSERQIAAVTLLFEDSGRVLPLPGGQDYTLGRISRGQPVLPDIDLNEYDGFARGVSRIHATLSIAPAEVTILDLGSANGTRVNGRKIRPHSPHLVQHGDILALGKLRIQALIRS